MFLATIIFVSLLLRLTNLNQSLWLDEASTALAAKLSLFDLFGKYLPGDFHPPFYYVLMHFWVLLFGSSEIALRVPSVLFGVGAVYLVYLLGTKIFGRHIGLIASALLSTSGLAVYYSQEARMYSLVIFLIVGLFYFYLQKKWIIFSILLLLLGLTDYVALFVIPIFLVLEIKNKKFVFSFLPLFIAYVIWSPILIRQMNVGLTIKNTLPGWWMVLGTLTLKNIVLIPVKFLIGRISFQNDFIYGMVLAPFLLTYGFLLSKFSKSKIILWMWLITPLFIGTLISFKIPTLSYFRYIFCLPALYLLAASGLGAVSKKARNPLIFVILSLNLITTAYYLGNRSFWREDWRGIAYYIESSKLSNSVTLFRANSNTEAYLYYAPNAKIAGPEQILGSYSEIWVLNYLQEVYDPDGLQTEQLKKAGYKEVGEKDFRGIGVKRYVLD
jgi:uncharacterized membrane protein